MKLAGRCLSVAIMLLAQTATAGGVRSDHPLLGTWTIMVPNTNCIEVYRIRSDGTRSYTSSEEVGEAAFEISDQPSARGFYTLSDTIIKDNGKRDCMGGVTPVGHHVTLFLSFEPSGNAFLMCQKEDMRTCFGLFTKAKSDDV